MSGWNGRSAYSAVNRWLRAAVRGTRRKIASAIVLAVVVCLAVVGIVVTRSGDDDTDVAAAPMEASQVKCSSYEPNSLQAASLGDSTVTALTSGGAEESLIKKIFTGLGENAVD